MEVLPYNPIMLRAILPQIGIFTLAILILILDLVLRVEKRQILAWITAAGLVLIGILTIVIARPTPAGGMLIFGGMLRWDWMSFLFTLLFLFGGAVTALLIKNYDEIGRQGEFYVLMLTSILGMSLMAGAADLIMLFLAIETTSIPLYILAGFVRKDPASSEAGFKYLLFGAVTSAVMLYGFSLLYGMSGSSQLYEIGQVFTYSVPGITSYLILLLILVGLGFKISAFPFHFWAPDVYQGAPTPVAGFLSTASKAAGFAVILRLLPVAFFEQRVIWSMIIAVLSMASMTFGNLQA
ncbi:MAG: NADH-quinone oxidoreductase subunit N, partial [Methanothrix sp.]